MVKPSMKANQGSVAQLLLLLCATLLASCSQATEPSNEAATESAQESTAEPILADELMEDHISFQFAIYYLPQPKADPLAELDRLLDEKSAPFERAERIEGHETKPTLAAQIESDPQTNYAPPDLESLHYFGRGLSREEAEALQKTEKVLVLDWAYSKQHVWTGLRSALELTHSLARRTGGLIWDEMTREVFSPNQWKEQRISDWTEDIPDLTKHTTIHAYNTDGSVRAISLGMEKFGLPDVVVEDFSWSLSRPVGHLITLVCQAMAEGAKFDIPGEFDLDIRGIENPKVREPQVTNLKPSATGVALLSLQEGTWEEGDPLNRLIEITFDRATGPDLHAKQSQILAQGFGWEDTATPIQHDEALQAASRRAREKLPTLRQAFRKGLVPGEYILVKAPFATSSGEREWMWVEVTSWEKDTITGLLRNEPVNIPNLHAGQIVQVSQEEVFDFIWKHADGTVDGNETGKLIQQRGP